MKDNQAGENKNALSGAMMKLGARTKNFNLALELAGGKEDKARKILEGKIKNIYAIKAKASIRQEGQYINFIVFIHKEKGRVEYKLVVVSRDSDTNKIFTNSLWYDFLMALYHQYNQQDTSGDEGLKFNELLDKVISDETIQYFISSVESGDAENISREIVYRLKQSGIADMEIICQSEIINELDYRLLLDDLEKTGKRDNEAQKKHSNEEKAGEKLPDFIKGPFLDAVFKLNPVSGYPVHNFQAGDRVFVLLNHNLKKEKAILIENNLFNDENGTALPMQCKILHASVGNKKNNLYILETADNKQIKIETGDNLMISAPEPPAYVREKEEKKQKQRTRIFLVSVICAFVLILAAAVVVVLIL